MKRYQLLLSAAFCVLATSCGDIQQNSSDAPSTSPVTGTVESRATDILSRMTLEEKIGQIIQADIASVTPQDAIDYNLGSVLNGGNSAPGGGKVAPPQEWIDLADAFWTASTDTSDGGVGVPLLWGTDAVHGHNNLASATIFPHNIGLGAANDPALMREIGDVTAREIRATGLDWTFAPTLAVARDDRWGRAYESYSENPAIVAAYAAPLIEGLQGELSGSDFLIGDNVMATAKHFVGDGGTTLGLDKGDTLGTDEDVMRIHGAGYGPAIEAGVQSVMASFSSVNGEKMHGSRRLLTDVLRGDLGFDGFVVGDWNGHAEIPGCTATDCPEALIAGVDMYMAPDSWRGLYDSLLAQAKAGEIPMARLDEAVRRVLEAKLRSGLFEAGLPSARATSDPGLLGQDDHREVARRAVRQSQVLLKNNGVLPLAPTATVLVTGSGADSMQQQTGGWTLDWQGTANANDEFDGGETVFAGLAAAMNGGGKAVLSTEASYTTRPDVAVVVFGEQPYAEYKGDRSDLVFEYEQGENIEIIRRLKAQNIPVVSVFLTGRPLWTNPHINASDAFVVAWLPGSEGGGVADVLVADENEEPRYDFTGRLSFSWPNDGRGEPINAADDAGVLFPYGYGLDYNSASDFKPLSEDPGLTTDSTSFAGQMISRGDAVGGLKLFVGDSSNTRIPVDGLSGASLGGAVSVKGVDYLAQEDSRQIKWSGSSEGTVFLAAGRPIDLTGSALTNLRLKWRITDFPDSLSIRLGCGEGCGATLDLSDTLDEADPDRWIETSIPLTCFTTRGLDLKNIDRPLSLSSGDAGSIMIHEASFTSTRASEATCPKPK